MLISLIAAVSDNGIIGKDNALPWHLPADLRFFKNTTMGHPIIMGRKNYESIGKALPGRTNIVLTHNPSFTAPNIIAANTLDAAFKAAVGAIPRDCPGEPDASRDCPGECFIIGGAEIYKQALPFCKKLYITRVHGKFEGNTYMPEFEHKFSRISCAQNFKDEKNPYDYDFEIWVDKT